MLNDQTRIWDYFQGEAVHSFDQAVPRLSFLLHAIRQLSRKRPWKLLNIGTGNGWLEQAGLSVGWQTFSLDPSLIAIRRVQDYGVAGQVGLIEHAPFRDGTFDAVVCSEVFEHLTDDQLQVGLIEIKRMLRPGGYLIGTVPFNEALARGETVCPQCGHIFHRWGHRQTFTVDSMRSRLEGAGFAPTRLEVRAFPYFEQHSFQNLVKTEVVKLIGRLGAQSVFPALCFFARKP